MWPARRWIESPVLKPGDKADDVLAPGDVNLWSGERDGVANELNWLVVYVDCCDVDACDDEFDWFVVWLWCFWCFCGSSAGDTKLAVANTSDCCRFDTLELPGVDDDVSNCARVFSIGSLVAGCIDGEWVWWCCFDTIELLRARIRIDDDFCAWYFGTCTIE